MTKQQTQQDQSIYDIAFLDASGKKRTLGEYRGEVLLIINTASY
ncbi:MAG TPA: hypothetical protein VGW38_04685 [Chloroflexota bacterium]|nr:hypothetical protein [Chloroflexota bacterium]